MHDKDVQNKNKIKLLKLHYVLNDATSVCVTVGLYASLHLANIKFLHG